MWKRAANEGQGIIGRAVAGWRKLVHLGAEFPACTLLRLTHDLRVFPLLWAVSGASVLQDKGKPRDIPRTRYWVYQPMFSCGGEVDLALSDAPATVLDISISARSYALVVLSNATTPFRTKLNSASSQHTATP
jgi:hypothetical protein